MTTATQTAPGTADGHTGTAVDFWFDPRCPWAWLTSRWLLEVAPLRSLAPRWHVMSLALLNENRDDISADYRDKVAATKGPVRVCIAAAQRLGGDVLLPLYTALGCRIHLGKEPLSPELIEAALADAGLPSDLAAAAESAEFDELLRASHDDGMNRVGTDVGTPVLSVNGVAFFGPVVTPMPRGDAAVRLWDGVMLVAGTPGFYELKRSRESGPIFD